MAHRVGHADVVSTRERRCARDRIVAARRSDRSLRRHLGRGTARRYVAAAHAARPVSAARCADHGGRPGCDSGGTRSRSASADGCMARVDTATRPQRTPARRRRAARGEPVARTLSGERFPPAGRAVVVAAASRATRRSHRVHRRHRRHAVGHLDPRSRGNAQSRAAEPLPVPRVRRAATRKHRDGCARAWRRSRHARSSPAFRARKALEGARRLGRFAGAVGCSARCVDRQERRRGRGIDHGPGARSD